MALTDLEIATLVERYARERDRYEKMAGTVGRYLSARLRDAAIPHVPTFRSKDPTSLKGKLTRDRADHEFVKFKGEFAPALLDLAGVRMMLYRPKDMDPTCTIIEDLFFVAHEDRFRKNYTNADAYQACHRVVNLRDEQIGSDPALANLREVPCEVQVVTIADHVWNELEHDITYKTPSGKASAEQAALLRTLRGQLNLVRSTVEQLMDATERQHAENLAVIESPDDLRQALKARTSQTFTGDLGRLLDLLTETLREVTRAELEKLPLQAGDLSDAASRLQAAGLTVSNDDAGLVVAALWPAYAEDFVEVVGSWRGKRGPTARLVRALDDAKKKGRI